MFEMIAFYLFSFLTIVMFYITVFSDNALYSLSSLAAGMIFISAFFFLLDADFLGVVQIVVYTGAVMALYAFGMMFFDSMNTVKEKINHPALTFLLSGMIALCIVLIFVAPIVSQQAIQILSPIDTSLGNVQNIGLSLFTKYLIPFEMAAVMLLVAMIGGIILAGKKMDNSYSDLEEEEIDQYEEKLRLSKEEQA